MHSYLHTLLAPIRRTEVVDVGANPIDGTPPYASMLAAGLCNVTGFEPQPEAFAALSQKAGAQERYLPYAVGDGGAHTLNLCVASGMASLFEPDPATLRLFDVLGPMGTVTGRLPVQTRRLDDIAEIGALDFLKIDIQGGELAVFKGGTAKLAHTVAIQTEVSFITLYRNQPVLGDVDLELRRQGFVPHCFANVKHAPISPCMINNTPGQALNQLLEADLVYVRDFAYPESLHDEQLKHLALVAHHCYNSFDLALRCVMLLEQRRALGDGAQRHYLQLLQRKS